jgi:hypothetical protein
MEIIIEFDETEFRMKYRFSWLFDYQMNHFLCNKCLHILLM